MNIFGEEKKPACPFDNVCKMSLTSWARFAAYVRVLPQIGF
jgi:hypothetical protein